MPIGVIINALVVVIGGIVGALAGIRSASLSRKI